jgi:hypothetical protein
MLKSYVDKIPTKGSPWVYGCPCCMSRKGKPLLRRLKRKKLKRMLKNELLENTPKENE